MKKEASAWEMRVSYRNRSGKEYLVISYDKVSDAVASDWEDQQFRVDVSGWSTRMKMGRWLVIKYFPKALMTSGGAGGSSTYRINYR